MPDTLNIANKVDKWLYKETLPTKHSKTDQNNAKEELSETILNLF